MRWIILVVACAVLSLAHPARASDFWGGFAGGALGGAAGSVIGNILSRPRAPPQAPPRSPDYYDDAVEPVRYCVQRFRSYNPRTGLYRGYDGQYHTCP